MMRTGIQVFFCIVGAVFIIAAGFSASSGQMDRLTFLLAVGIIVSFLYLNYLLLSAYVLTRDRIHIAWLVALFLWPIVTSAVSYSLTGAESLSKKGLEYRIGGFGDCLAVGFMQDVEGLNKQFRLPSFLLMLGTNTAFLIPVLMMVRRARARARSESTGEKTQP